MSAVAALVGVVSCGGGVPDAPPDAADLERVAAAVDGAVAAQDPLVALACGPDEAEESMWTAEEQAVWSPTIDEAVEHVIRDDVWPSYDLPAGSRYALVDRLVEIGRTTWVPVLVNDELRVLLAVDRHVDGEGYTISGSLRCR